MRSPTPPSASESQAADDLDVALDLDAADALALHPSTPDVADIKAARTAFADEEWWFCWALRSTSRGFEYTRVRLPASLVATFRIGKPEAPTTRAIAIARIENEMRSDRVSDKRGWNW